MTSRGALCRAGLLVPAFCILMMSALFVGPGARATWAGDGAADAGKAEDGKAEDGKAAEAAAAALEERFDALKKDVEEHEKASDEGAIKADLDRARTLFADAAADEKLQAKVLQVVGGLAKGTRDEDRTVAVLETLGSIGDERCARYIKPYLRQRDEKEAEPLLVAAIKAAGQAPDDSLVHPLLTLVSKSKHMGIVQDAVACLGNFRRVKRGRVKILDELVELSRRCKPGGPPRNGRGPGDTVDDGGYSGGGNVPPGQEGSPAARWGALSSSVPRALAKLTGIEQSSIQDWFVLHKENKRNLAKLFPSDE